MNIVSPSTSSVERFIQFFSADGVTGSGGLFVQRTTLYSGRHMEYSCIHLFINVGGFGT